MTAASMRGASGVTHCGQWVRWHPGDEALWMNRLVCTLPAGHSGKHRHAYSRREWSRTGDVPTLAEDVTACRSAEA